MIEELNLPCLYKVILDRNNQIYSFTTASHIEYQLVFIDASLYFSGTTTEELISKIYTLNIDKVGGGKAITDTEVQKTVECIASHFFEDSENSLVYVCDTADNKQEARRRKFNKWFNDYEVKNDFIKLDEVIHTPEAVHNISLIYNKRNPFAFYLEQAYFEAVETLNKPE